MGCLLTTPSILHIKHLCNTDHLDLEKPPKIPSFIKTLPRRTRNPSLLATMLLGKKLNPMIGKLAGVPISGTTNDGSTSPRSPLDRKVQSARCPKSYDLGGVGLAIVAALEQSGEIPAGMVVYSRKSKRSLPIPVNAARIPARVVSEPGSLEEEYTIVTCRRGADNKTYTRVYCDNGEVSSYRNTARSNRPSVFTISPARFADTPACPDSDFLNSCHLCHKKLTGKDIYMYRGEKGFCSTECRYRQIVMDERKENCSLEISGSPYKNGQLFSTGILAV
ncbi:unnamed protein product [Cuscuta europaea]|uniref:FLZ-type domain-containing protein n=1 Tax=Cuscuta europaea TaxID=41803 RepID=A0A9P1ELW3_CUSEU|nr:unnamed protein product [Cuscuta europaea]